METLIKQRKLVEELESLRQPVAELEKRDAERKRVEKTLPKSEERYRDLYEEAPNMHFSVSVDGRSLMASHSVVELPISVHTGSEGEVNEQLQCY